MKILNEITQEVIIEDRNVFSMKELIELAVKNDANLSGADLSGANLSGADLRYANLDFSCLSLSCNSLNFKSDEKQRIQIAYHLLSLMKHEKENITEEEKKIFDFVKGYANKFHRNEVNRL